jgi:nicotinic acid mononucleotide adenylyltransferase
MKTTIPIEYIKKWRNNDEIIEHCQHIISHSERYEKERVFEAKTVIQKLSK